MDQRSKMLVGDRPIRCQVCGGKLEYKGRGAYQCTSCGKVSLDTFGKVRTYIEEHGPSPATEISLATGVRIAVIEDYLKHGRLEIPENSEVFIKCEKCGCEIRYGRFCPECAKSLANDVKKAFLVEDVGECPKRMSGKMRYMGKDRK